jgi:hypothetical protein
VLFQYPLVMSHEEEVLAQAIMVTPQEVLAESSNRDRTSSAVSPLGSPRDLSCWPSSSSSSSRKAAAIDAARPQPAGAAPSVTLHRVAATVVLPSPGAPPLTSATAGWWLPPTKRQKLCDDDGDDGATAGGRRRRSGPPEPPCIGVCEELAGLAMSAVRRVAHHPDGRRTVVTVQLHCDPPRAAPLLRRWREQDAAEGGAREEKKQGGSRQKREEDSEGGSGTNCQRNFETVRQLQKWLPEMPRTVHPVNHAAAAAAMAGGAGQQICDGAQYIWAGIGSGQLSYSPSKRLIKLKLATFVVGCGPPSSFRAGAAQYDG